MLTFGFELLPVGIYDETELAKVETSFRLVVADIDDADFGQFVREKRPDPLPRTWIEHVKRIVHHDPARPLQNDAGKRKALLLIFGQLPVPSIHCVKVRLEVFKSNTGQGVDDSRMIKGIDWVRISDDLAQRAGRDIGSHWHEHDRAARGVRDFAASPGPKTSDGPKQQGFFFAILASDQDALVGVDVRMRLAQRAAPRR